MKTVFTDASQVAHLWANKKQESAKNSGHNFFFQGDTIYSYGSHFPIARHFKDVVLFTLRTYSVTTSSHISMTRGACSHLPKVYCYEIPNSKQDTGAHQKNFERWANEVKENISKLKNARKPAMYVSAIESIISQVNEYVKFFKLKLTAEQKAIFTVRDADKYKEALIEEARKKELFEKHILTAGKKLFERSRLAWFDYDEKNFRESLTNRQKDLLQRFHGLQDGNATYLRSDGETVETSKGIKLPVAVAQRYYRWYLKTADAGGCFNSDCGYKVLDYDVTQASTDGLVVGCHQMNRAEIDALATKLGW